MNDEELLLEEVKSAPAESAPLSIYADWLEERHDPRAEFVRLVLQFRFDASRDQHVCDRLQELGRTLRKSWVRKVTAGLNHKPLRKLLGQTYQRTPPKTAREAEVALFVSKYGKKSQSGKEPYDRQVEEQVKRMKPEELDAMLRGEYSRSESRYDVRRRRLLR